MYEKYAESISEALKIAMLVSPTGKEQMAFAAFVNRMRGSTENSDKQILRGLLAAIGDGLNKNIWPEAF